MLYSYPPLNQTPSQKFISILYMSGMLLKTVKQHSYLGIQMNHYLSWNLQVDYVCSKAMRLIGFMQRYLRNCFKELKELSYKQFVIPVLEYAVTVWDPYHLHNI